MALTLNRYTDGEGNVHDTEGTIVFSGELYQGEEEHLSASRYSSFLADTTLYGGASCWNTARSSAGILRK